jgi:preprotein translocase subunit SecF
MFEKLFENIYSRLTAKVDYRVLALLTPVFSVLLLLFVAVHGMDYGIDFKGGMWLEVLTDKKIDSAQINSLILELEGIGLKDVKADVGFDINTGQDKLTVQTTTVVSNTTALRGILENYAGKLTDYDTATVRLPQKPPETLKESLEKRLKYGIDLSWADGILTVKGMDMNKDDVESALQYHLQDKVTVEFAKKNFNSRVVGPTLGETFKGQGFKALIWSFILMSLVVFLAFKEFIPCIAVIQAAFCDIMISVGGMSLFHIPLEPATIGALLMLIGYSVDTDIMLTTRTLKDRSAKFNELVDGAVKTGLTMNGATLTALVIIYIVSVTLTQITLWSNISLVLIIGLIADLPATWLTNAGIIKWYLEGGGRNVRFIRWRR